MFYKYGPKKPVLKAPTPSPTPTQTQIDELYWEKDDINPNNVTYDLENNKVIVDDDIKPIIVQTIEENKLIVKNVSDTRYRNNR